MKNPLSYLSFIVKKSKRRELSGWTRNIVIVVAVGMATFHLYTAATRPLAPIMQRLVHLSFVLSLIFLLYPAREKSPKGRPSFFDLTLVALIIITQLNLLIRYNAIARSGGLFNRYDIWFGVITVMLVFEGCRRILGLILPILAGIFLAYNFVGPYVPGIFAHPGFSINRVIQHMYLTTEGVYSMVLGVSATYIVLFIIFSSMLRMTGLTELFNDFAMSIAGPTTGGPAKVSVVSSCFMGTITGSTSANVATTGAFTIPLMKKIGYPPHVAGGVEAASSCGGQIMPPVMGAAAFIIADTLGIPYIKVAASALIPAVLYYLGIMTIVHYRAKRLGLVGLPRAECPRMINVITEKGYRIFPLFVIIYLLIKGYNPMFSAFWGIVTSVIISFFSKATRPNLKIFINSLSQGAIDALLVASACSIIGVIVGTVSLTGIGFAIARSVVDFTHGKLFLTLFLTMVVAMILGLEMPTTACYLVTSVVAAPALIMMHIYSLAAHLFVFYFGLLSTLTPPVSVGAYTAAALAGASPISTALFGVRLAFGGFIVPYLFVYHPALVLAPGASFLNIVFNLILAVIIIFFMGVAIEGYFFKSMNIIERIITFASVIFLLTQKPMFILLSVLLLSFMILFQWKKKAKKVLVAKEL